MLKLVNGENDMKELVLCDDDNLEFVLPLCEKYGLGIEIQGFYKPQLIDKHDDILNKYKNILPKNISKYLHAPFADLCLGSSSHKIVEATKFYFDYAYKVAKELNCKRITVHNGYVPGTSYIPNWNKRAIAFWQEYLKDKKDVAFDMENVLEWNADSVIEIIDKSSIKNLGVNLDIGHANCNSKESVLKWIKKLGDKITYVHLHNNHGKTDEHLGLTNGNINIKKVLKALNKYCPNAVWALECKIEHLEDSILLLKKLRFI